jgi:methylmalonyl-CoA/ethylmalonyl-CoA epimerase
LSSGDAPVPPLSVSAGLIAKTAIVSGPPPTKSFGGTTAVPRCAPDGKARHCTGRAEGFLLYVKIPIMLLTIDHVGIACRDLDAAIERYVSVFGLAVVSRETNAEQGVKEAMLATESGASYVQLLEPLSPGTPVGKFLERRGEGMHHVGYAVADVTAALAEIGATGVRLIDSRPRHGSMGASIAFLHPGDLGGVLTELVQPLG